MKKVTKPSSTTQKALAWGVHLFTASGVVLALLAIIAASDHDFRMCMVWLAIALIVDGVDGMMARKARVSEVLPYMKGKNIDFVIDFATYAIIPAYFLYEAYWVVDGERVSVLPESMKLLALSILLLVSAMYYGKEPMVSEDMHFIGFPVMWNAVAYFIFFVLQPAPWVNFGLIIFFAILHFVPLKYAYPSQNTRYKVLNWSVVISCVLTNAYVLWVYPEPISWQLKLLAAALVPYIIWHTLWISLVEKS